MKKLLFLPLILVLLTALAIGLGAAVKYDSDPEYSLGSTLLVDGEVSDVISIENNSVTQLNSGSGAGNDSLIGYRLTAGNLAGSFANAIYSTFDIGSDDKFTFSLGIPSENCLVSFPDGGYVKSFNPDARVAVTDIHAFFSDSRTYDNKIIYGSFSGRNNYRADLYIYSTESTMLTGSVPGDKGLTVYNVKLMAGWNRVLQIKKDNLLLITNGENKEGKWIRIKKLKMEL